MSNTEEFSLLFCFMFVVSVWKHNSVSVSFGFLSSCLASIRCTFKLVYLYLYTYSGVDYGLGEVVLKAVFSVLSIYQQEQQDVFTCK